MRKIMLALLVLVELSFSYNYGHSRDVKVDNSLLKEYIRQLNNLTEEQKYTLETVYKRCIKYDLGKTCVAIAWEESQFGVYKVIPWSGDYGIMGINLKWYMIDNNYNHKNKFMRSKLATRLTCNDDYNIMYAIAKLQKLKSRYKKWKLVWAHYNGGSTPNYIYAKRILNKIVAFKIWLSKG